MSLSHLLPDLVESPSLSAILAGVAKRESVELPDVPPAGRAVVAAAVAARAPGPLLVVTPRADRADRMAAAIATYLPPGHDLALWPAPDALPFEQLPFDLGVATERVRVLDRLANADADDRRPPVVVTSVSGLSHLVMPPAALRVHARRITVGSRVDVESLLHWAVAHGYLSVPLVQAPGELAHRGGIVDLFAPGSDLPVRVDLFGDEVETIRTFDPSTQRSTARLREIRLLPPSELPIWNLASAAERLRLLPVDELRPEVAAEWQRMLDQMDAGIVPASIDLFAPYLLDRDATLVDYLGDRATVIVDDPSAVSLAAGQLAAQAAELEQAFVANAELPPGLASPIAMWERVSEQLGQFPGVTFDGSQSAGSAGVEDAPNFAGRLGDVVEHVRDRLADNWRVAIATDQVDRLTEIFEDHDVFPRRDKRRGVDSVTALPLPPGTLEIRASDLDGGWAVPDVRTLVLSDLEVFGFRKQVRRAHRRPGFQMDSEAFARGLVPGEFVVHVDHGVARFTGLVRLETNGVEREYMLLTYAKDEKLYVPVDQSDRVSRYSGGGLEPTLTRLGSGEWAQVKRKVRKAVREMAFELIQLYAARETATGHAFPADTTWDHELAESFPFTETPDQQRAIDATRGDMESTEPMDRLICGDVGFGKTEVALRAAFKAVNNGRQVAVLVPTTVLALQHFTTFSQRLAPFPVRVEMLSRLRSKAEQRETLGALADGAVDIVIGTHRLVQRDVAFHNLGLVVIDEEQRFGVRQKEFLKKLRTEVDVMTMSATPIPRTLHMALAGIRDISIIDTAPQLRLPVRTFVTARSDQLVREAILRELDRGGQVYFVHNRVHDIDHQLARLRALVPEARFGVGHGQMDEDVLEEVVLGFVRHDFDVLLSTTIIESGIDIPNVNTIVIDNADTLGLTQLYQLRGRVGRSANRAYAYLLFKPEKALSEEAHERLDAIQEATELGAGLKVAMRDMEIRGAGNVLGAEQSGHIAAIGYELYIRLLSQAVEEIRAGQPIDDRGPVTLDLPLTALIPVDYIPDTELRLATYRRVAGVASLPELAAMRDELDDRFGPAPEEVEHLLALIALRVRAEALGVESMVEREREIVVRPVETAGLGPRLRNRLGPALKLTPNSVRLRLADLAMPWQEAIDLVLDALPPRAAQTAVEPAVALAR